MKNTIQEVGYDDPTRKKLSEYEVLHMLSEAYTLLLSGVNQLEQITNSVIIDDSLKKEVQNSALKIIDELTRLHTQANKYVQQLNPGEMGKLEKIMKIFDRGPKHIGLNETIYGKVDATIKRIIEVNKKLNHGTKFK